MSLSPPTGTRYEATSHFGVSSGYWVDCWVKRTIMAPVGHHVVVDYGSDGAGHRWPRWWCVTCLRCGVGWPKASDHGEKPGG